MAERLKKLKRLRHTWEQRKRSTEYKMAAIATEISQVNAEEQHLAKCLDGGEGLYGQFTDLVAQRLHGAANRKASLGAKMDSVRVIHRKDAMNLRRCEILEGRQKSDLERREEAASLENILEVFLSRKS